MCQISIGEVIEIQKNMATIRFRGKTIEVKTDLIGDLKTGEFVSFSSGIAIEKIERGDAKYICG